MGLTFSLASFACVGPFVGTLLAASATGGGARPAIGMVVFASGLALPFFLFALFPSYLKRLPKSGGWLARVKVVMAFVILAASLKYLSSLDQAAHWGLLTRERFLALWIVLFACAGLYLLGFLRLEGVKPDDRLGLGRLLTGVVFLAFALSLAPGMFGGRLGELDAFVPEPAAGSQTSGGAQSSALDWMKDDYRGALDRARSGGQARLRLLHRLRLHELPLDEGQYALAAGDRIGSRRLRVGGTLYRRNGCGIRCQRQTGAHAFPDERRTVLRHRGRR